MAITVIETPKSYNPIYNDNVVLLSSNLTSNPKFKFVIDVELQEGAFFLSLGRFKCPAISDLATNTTRGYFNLKELLSSSFFFATKDITTLDKKSWPIRITPGEEYAASPTAAPVYYPASGQAFTYVGFNGSLRLKEYIDFVPTDLINTTTIAASSGIGQYALSSYFPKKVLPSTINELTFLTNGGTNTRARVRYYNGATLITSQVLTTPTANNTDVTVDISYAALTVPSTATRYTVQLERISNGNPLSPEYEYQIGTPCSKFEKVNVYFQNKWGGIDAYVFNMRETVTDQIERNNYKKMDRYIQTYNTYNQASQTYASNIKTTHVLNTDWVTEDEMNWLSELAESNNVIMSYDGTVTYSGGSNAYVELFFDEWSSNGNVVGNITATFNTPFGTFPITIPDGTPYDTFGDGFIDIEVIPLLQASGLSAYYDFVTLGGASEARVRIIAKNLGTGSNITSVTVSGDVVAENNTPGTNFTTINYPTQIPVTVDNTTFEFKKSTVDKLFQLQLTVTETPIYNRQTQ